MLAQGKDIVPIPGTKHINYLKENIDAVDVELTDADIEHLNEAIPLGSAAGDRYPNMSTVNR